MSKFLLLFLAALLATSTFQSAKAKVETKSNSNSPKEGHKSTDPAPSTSGTDEKQNQEPIGNMLKKWVRMHPSPGEEIRFKKDVLSPKTKPWGSWTNHVMWSCPGTKDGASISTQYCKDLGKSRLSFLGCSSAELNCVHTNAIGGQVDCEARSGSCNNYCIEKCEEGWEKIELTQQDNLFFATDADGNTPSVFCKIKPAPKKGDGKKSEKVEDDVARKKMEPAKEAPAKPKAPKKDTTGKKTN